jgi:hypothetical protein
VSIAALVVNGLRGAALLARGRPDGLRFFPGTMDDAARSFVAVAVTVPIIVGIRLIAWAENGEPASGGRILLRDMMVYAVSWMAFAIMSYRIAGTTGRTEQWPRFMVAWNWCNVVGSAIVMVGGVPSLLNVPAVVEQAAELVALGWALWLEWYVVRVAFNAGPLLAAYLVMLDQIIGLAFAIMGLSLGPR